MSSARVSRLAATVMAVAAMALIAIVVVPYLTRRDGRDSVSACRNNVLVFGNALLLYAEDNGGRLPPSGWDGLHSRPEWLQALHEWRVSQDREDVLDFTKCPKDRSSDATTYEVNPELIGERLDRVPVGDRAHRVLVFEKCHAGTHCWVYYLDGHVTQISR